MLKNVLICGTYRIRTYGLDVNSILLVPAELMSRVVEISGIEPLATRFSVWHSTAELYLQCLDPRTRTWSHCIPNAAICQLI